MPYVLDDDDLKLYLIGQLHELLIAEHQWLPLADIDKGASLAAQVSDVVRLILEDNLRVSSTDRQLIGIAEVVLRTPAELCASQVEHLELSDLLIFQDHVVERL